MMSVFLSVTADMTDMKQTCIRLSIIAPATAITKPNTTISPIRNCNGKKSNEVLCNYW